MKDWAFNRQRYWGEPIPIVHCPDLWRLWQSRYEELPLRLPDVEDFQPGEDGDSLRWPKIDSFVNCKCPKCGRRTQSARLIRCRSGQDLRWYFLRYIDPHNDNELAAMDKLNYWMPVDWYNGGMEHVTRHMIYSRFWHHFLYDIGVVQYTGAICKAFCAGYDPRCGRR